MDLDVRELQDAFDRDIKAIDEAYERAAKRSGLSPASFDILYALYAYGDGCTQKDLCARCFDGKQTINSAVHRMVREGLLSLEAGRGRSTSVYLTDAGRASAAQSIVPVMTAERRAIESIGADRAALLSAALGAYARALVRALDGEEGA